MVLTSLSDQDILCFWTGYTDACTWWFGIKAIKNKLVKFNRTLMTFYLSDLDPEEVEFLESQMWWGVEPLETYRKLLWIAARGFLPDRCDLIDLNTHMDEYGNMIVPSTVTSLAVYDEEFVKLQMRISSLLYMVPKDEKSLLTTTQLLSYMCGFDYATLKPNLWFETESSSKFMEYIRKQHDPGFEKDDLLEIMYVLTDNDSMRHLLEIADSMFFKARHGDVPEDFIDPELLNFQKNNR